MAISPKDEYIGKIDNSDPVGYPEGKAQNITTPGDQTGTPLEAKWVNDWFGFVQAIMDDVGTVPSGTPEKVGASQVLDAIKDVAASFGGSIGTVAAWTTGSVPIGHLECDGSAVSRTTYSGLFAEISTIYGIGDGATTFNLPDYRGEFLRGFDNGAGNDPDSGSRTDAGGGNVGDNIGTKQLDDLESHVHNLQFQETNKTSGGADCSDVVDSGSNKDTDATGGNETRPRNVYVMYIIKH